MKKLLTAILLATGVLAGVAATALAGPVSPFRAIPNAEFRTGQAVLVIVDAAHRVAAYTVDVWGERYVAVPAGHPAAEGLRWQGVEPGAGGIIALTCSKRHNRDALVLAAGQAGYAVFCQ